MSEMDMTAQPQDTMPLEPVSARHPELAGRVAVITGGAKGIGRGIAHRLAAEGMRIAVADIDEAALLHTAGTLEAGGAEVVAVAGDMGDGDDITRLFGDVVDRFGTVDLLVNNAADLRRSTLLEADDALLDYQLAANVRGPYLCSRAAAAIMRAGAGGSIVSLSSVGAVRAHHLGLPYDVTKGAIDAMTRALAIDLGMYGIRVNAVAPGVTTTYRSRDRTASPSGQAMVDDIPLRRSGTVLDMAAAIAFLASDDAGYITGQVLAVDGGITAQLGPPRRDAHGNLDLAGTL